MASPLLSVGPADQKAFLDYDREGRIRLTKIGCILTFLLMPAGTSLDANVYPGMVSSFMKVRLLVSFLAAIIWLLLTLKATRKFYILWGLLLPLMPLLSINWMIYATQGANSPYYAGLLMISVPMALLLPWTFWENLLVGVLTVGTYVLACWAHGTVSQGGIYYSNLFFLINTILFCVIGTFFSSRLRLSEFISRHQLDKSRRDLEETNQKLLELDQMKSRFFANISHELRTPLTLIISPLDNLLKQKTLDAETQAILLVMNVNAMRLLKLINDLLDLVKLESKRMEVKKESLDVGLFIKGLIQSVAGVARDKRLQMIVSIPSDLGKLWLDRDKLEKILLNLVFNALKFTPAGGRVELKVQNQNDMLTLEVVDNGVGISQEHLPYIFDRFWQADSASNRKYQGTGIGLALVKELVELQGGEVKAISQTGVGTTMRVRIPTPPSTEALSAMVGKDPPPALAAPSDEWMSGLYRRAEFFPALSSLSDTLRPESFRKNGKPQVLVVDDEPDVLNFLKNQLSKNYDVLEAVDGNQAVEKSRQFLPEMVVLDMMMPEKDGITVCREIKANLSTQSIPILLLTARADDETKLAALNAGANDFLTKPFSTTELQVRIRNLVDSHQKGLELGRQNKRLEATLERLKETEATLIQTEKMSSLGRMSAGMIHEINNPLNYALAALSVLKTMREKWPEKEQAKLGELLSDIEEGMTRVQVIVSDLRGFTHPLGRAAERINLAEVIAIALRFLGHETAKGIRVEMEVPTEQQVFAEKNGLIHVFTNLFQNSVDALKAKKMEGEQPVLSIRSRVEGKQVKVLVRDNGMGISPQYLDKIFDPFFTTKDVGEGMGLGLSICYRILQDQGGKISVKSELGQFTEFLLELPLN